MVDKGKILVVDDEQDNLDAFRFNFRKVFDIVSAGSRSEARALLRKLDRTDPSYKT